MEKSLGSPEVSKFYSPPTPVTYAYPPEIYDTMATSYVHSLTSTPYYNFIPHYAYASGHNYPLHYYAYNNGSRFGFASPTTASSLAAPMASLQYPNVSPTIDNHHEKHSRLQESDFSEGRQVDNLGDDNRKSLQGDDEKSIDPRVINILEPFRQLYSEQEESLKGVFPGIYSKLSEFFKKVNSLILDAILADEEKSKPSKTLKRSLSLGSPSCKNEWFKVRPIDADDNVITSSEGKKGDGQDAI